jgi:pimeloyl-ACP methyl ester carboxylesterase
MTDWNVGDVTMERWVEDLEAVVDAAAPEEPFTLLGISQGAATCVSYAYGIPNAFQN